VNLFGEPEKGQQKAQVAMDTQASYEPAESDTRALGERVGRPIKPSKGHVTDVALPGTLQVWSGVGHIHAFAMVLL